jgi:branched-chain amino acid transport system ATP-binding protein
MDNTVLEVRELELSFGGLKALNGISLKVNKGEILALLGPNGSGKTCVLNVVNGIYKVQRGSVIFRGKDITGLAPHVIANFGIGRTFQNLELFRGMTVLDNLSFGRHSKMKSNIFSAGIYWGLGQKEEITSRQKVEEIIDFLELERYRKQLVGGLPFGIQKLVGVGRALAMEPELLLLDEPASGMSRQEKEDLARFLLRIKYQLGITVVWVEHDIKIVGDLCDQAAVLDNGHKIAEGSPDEVFTDPEVAKAYLGTT